MLESTYKREIRKVINSNEGKAIPLVTAELTHRGEPDIIGVLSGLPFVIEAKVGTNEPTQIQIQRLEEWHDAGMIPIVARYPAHPPDMILGFLYMLYEDNYDYKSFTTVEKWAEYFNRYAISLDEEDDY